jgi:hypothetical protein
MIAQRNLRRVGWAAVLAVACALLFGLSLRVNAIKSEVRRAEIRIVALKHEKLYLETEFETRSNQQQLESWNDVEFGYVAPGPGQFLESTNQLASLGRQPAAAPLPVAVPAAAQPIQVAVARTSPAAVPLAMVSGGSREPRP